MPFTNITPKEAFQKMEEGFVYLDVRTPREFEQGHAKGAVNIPVIFATPTGREQNPNFLKEVDAKFPRTTKFVVGCHSGGRSAVACEMLSEAGYSTLCNIDGGFGSEKGWKTCGLPVE